MRSHLFTKKSCQFHLFVLSAILVGIFVYGCKKSTDDDKSRSQQTDIGNETQLDLPSTQILSNKYQATVSTYKHFNFNQPSKNKIRNEVTGTESTLLYSYESENSEKDTLYNILIHDFSVAVQDKNTIQFGDKDDSSSVKQKKIGEIIGQDYKIEISDNADINIVNPENLVTNISQAEVAEIISKIFEDKQTVDLYHHILIYDSQKLKSLKKGVVWEEYYDPDGLLAPRRYKKEYVVKGIDQNGIATINITGTFDKLLDTKKGKGVFARMFDVQETYGGQMTVDTISEKVLNYQENLSVVYTAENIPEGESTPDKLEMIFNINQKIHLVE